MVRAIICVDITEFHAIEARLHEGLSHDDSNYRAMRWMDEPKQHPTDGRIAILIESRVERYLTGAELARVVELESDWFPEMEA